MDNRSYFAFDFSIVQLVQSMFHVILLIIAKILDTLYSSFVFEVDSISNNNNSPIITRHNRRNSSSENITDNEDDSSMIVSSKQHHVTFQTPPSSSTPSSSSGANAPIDPTCKHHPLRRMSNLFFFNNDSIDSRLDELIDDDLLWRKRATSAPSDISPSHCDYSSSKSNSPEKNNDLEVNIPSLAETKITSTNNVECESTPKQIQTNNNNQVVDLPSEREQQQPILTPNDEAKVAMHILDEHSSNNSKRRGFLTKSSSTNSPSQTLPKPSTSTNGSCNPPPPLGKGNSFVELRKKLTEFEFPKRRSENDDDE